ncbi:MAG: VWA domain-containing protein [Burkholderiaceae bacterium]
MGFESPQLLWLLAIGPLLIALYLFLLGRGAAVRHSHLALIKAAQGTGGRWRRHLPAALLLLALVLLVVAIARPNAFLRLPSQYKTIVLAMDVSLSMQADDMEPDRFAASKSAARAFVRGAPDDVKIGLVEFAGTASPIQMPTVNRQDLLAAIDRTELQRGTATGSALLVSLAMLFPDLRIDPRLNQYGALRSPLDRSQVRGARPLDESVEAPRGAVPTDPGSYKSGLIILLTDGRRTMGPDPLDVAQLAAERGVRTFTVGFGTREGGQVQIEGWSMFLKLDDEALKGVAQLTGGEYFHASSEDALRRVYEGLTSKLVMERQQTEISALFVGLAALATLLAWALSQLWFHRPR